MREHAIIAAALLAAAAAAGPVLAGECTPDWDRTIGTAGVTPAPGANGFSPYIGAFATFNDGTGEALYIGGTFDSLGGICGTSRIAKWDGTTYVPLGDGVSGEVKDMVVFDDGTGPALFVAGSFSDASGVANTAKIAKWTGSQWQSVTTGLEFFTNVVYDLQVWDDGTGAALYLGGVFTAVDGVSAMNIAKYDGTTFSPLAGGVGAAGGYRVADMEVFNGKLIVGGLFADVDGGSLAAEDVAAWNGTAWENIGAFGIVGGGVQGYVNDLQVFDDGTGAKLYIGGRRLLSPDLSVPSDFGGLLVWDGGNMDSSITSAGIYLPDTVVSLGVLDDGTGAALYAGRQFGTTPGRPEYFVALTGTGWVGVGGDTDDSVFGMFTWDSGTGSDLYVGGGFTAAGGQPAGGLAVWNGGTVTDPAGWDRTIGNVAAAPTFGIADGYVGAFAVRNIFGQDYMYIGGSFSGIGGVCGSSGIVYWNAQSGFGAMDQGVNNNGSSFEVTDIEVFDDGTGEAIFVAGTFRNASGVPNTSGIAKWNGGSWEAVAEFGFFLDAVRSLEVWDDGTGPALYIGGSFAQIRKPGDPSFVVANSVAKYDGTTFTALGATPGIQAGGFVQALEVFENKLYVGGRFFTAGGMGVECFAAWDGTTWSRPDQFRLDNAFIVYDFEVFDDGTGEQLYIAGRSLDILEDPTDPLSLDVVRTSVAKYDGGTDILSLSYEGVLLQDSEARTLAVFNDGTGDALYAGGAFTTVASYLAKLTNTGWQTVGGGTDASVTELFVWDDDTGTGEQLYAGGSFANAGGLPASGVAAWTGCPAPVCPCELDGNDAQVDVFDLLAYLDLWFASDAGADIDGTAGVDVFDLLAYLDCWFPASAGAPCP